MSQQGDDKARLRRQATKDAIELAMQSRWQEAVAVNRRIIESFPTEVDAHNRLGRALTELGEFSEARDAYKHALELDPQNSIARKNLTRLSLLREDRQVTEAPPKLMAPHQFIEERGKAGIVLLVDAAPTNILARLVAGDEVDLHVEGQRLMVKDRLGVYLGQVDPRHAPRLVKLTHGGNRYSAAIASLSAEGVKVIIKEVYGDPSQAGRLSFPLQEAESFRSYIRSGLMKLEAEDELLTLDEEGEYLPEAEETEERPPVDEESRLRGDEGRSIDES
ncbi:MAG: tetratricopeptide repeat protein [Chloroflexi bacterium]|nr:tetratricopeptide repeat protein [Chloroflexota bacterium]